MTAGISDAGQIVVDRSGEPGNGPFFEVTLRVVEGQVAHYSFRSHECLWATATGIAMGMLVERRSFDEARAINHERLSHELQGMPSAKIEYLRMIVSAVRGALMKADLRAITRVVDGDLTPGSL